MRVQQFDLNLLVALQALLAEESVTGAAVRLSVSQPAMSATLARLRTALGDPLLERQGRRMVRTQFASAMQQGVSDVLLDVGRIINQSRTFDPLTATLTFSILASELATISILGRLRSRLETRAPGVRLRLVPIAQDFPQRVARGDVDLAIVPQAVLGAERGLVRRELLRDDYVLVTDPTTALRAPVSIETFSTLPYLAVTYEGARSLVDDHLDAAGITRMTEISANVGAAPFLLRGSNLVAVLPRRLAEAVHEGLGLVMLPSPIRLPDLIEVMVWAEHETSDPIHSWLRSELLALVG